VRRDDDGEHDITRGAYPPEFNTEQRRVYELINVFIDPRGGT